MTAESYNTNQLQNGLDSEESIDDLAWMLEGVKSPEELAELQTVPEFTPDRLNLAARRLSIEKRQQLRWWAIENQQRR